MKKKNIKRKTKETDIVVNIKLGGGGYADITLPDKFLKHMLETLARFWGIDLVISAKGDLHHHINEDVAITLGRALRDAIKEKSVRRIGSANVAMDDALVNVTVDLVDRPYFDVNLPDEMFIHFLRSFALEGRFTLHNIILKGKNTHHIIEACFKALGLALKDATTPSNALLSTKGKAKWR